MKKTVGLIMTAMALLVACGSKKAPGNNNETNVGADDNEITVASYYFLPSLGLCPHRLK